MRLEALLRPRSVAIVGASDNVGPGFNAWNALRCVGYSGEIHLVESEQAGTLRSTDLQVARRNPWSNRRRFRFGAGRERA